MSEKYKLGLTRNRLFSLDNTVIFEGICTTSFDEKECAKVLKMLSVKEPIITGAIELDDDASAYVVTEKYEPLVAFTDDSADFLKKQYEKKGINPFEKLFEFWVCGENTLVIAAHTSVCDSKSLLRLAKEFVDFYTHCSVSVEPSDINLFSDVQKLPANLNSPVIDKLSADIESKWGRKKVSFTADDYIKAIEKHSQEKSEIKTISKNITLTERECLTQYCKENNIDLSSLAAYGFYEAVCGEVEVPKKARRLSVFTDRRFFISGLENCLVGAFNGCVDVSLKPKDRKKGTEDKLKAFHFAHYKGVTSAFRAFYDELLLSKITPVFCDASYMSVAGCYSSSATVRLANNYGCNNVRVMSLFSCDLRQEYWSQLSFFDTVTVQEPFVRRFYTMVDVVICDDGAKVNFRYDTGKISGEKATVIVENAMKNILQFVK